MSNICQVNYTTTSQKQSPEFQSQVRYAPSQYIWTKGSINKGKMFIIEEVDTYYYVIFTIQYPT